MNLTEAYLKDIIRPPPTGSVPANVAHPFQSSFYTYVTKKFLPKHWYLAAGATFTLTLYGTLDALRESGKKKAYDDAVASGRPPCESYADFVHDDVVLILQQIDVLSCQYCMSYCMNINRNAYTPLAVVAGGH